MNELTIDEVVKYVEGRIRDLSACTKIPGCDVNRFRRSISELQTLLAVIKGEIKLV